jgi:hypothetical protein
MTLKISETDLLSIALFEYCSCFDNSVFWRTARFMPVFTRDLRRHEKATAVTIDDFGAEKFVLFIDKIAEQIFSDIITLRRDDAKNSRKDSLQRLACYLASEGQNEYVRFAERRLLHFVHGPTYFPKIGFAEPIYPVPVQTINVETREAGKIMPRNVPITLNTDKPHYKLAYTLLVHNNIHGVSYLINTLSTPNTIIMIHVDGKNPEFKQTLMKLVQDMKQKAAWENVFVTKNSHPAVWAGVGIVYGQLTAYFELLDICTFEYVINASSNDVALMDPDLMYKWILDTNPSANYMINLAALDENGRQETFERVNNIPVFTMSNYSGLMRGNQGTDKSDLRIRSFSGYGFWTTWQWTILTYSLIHSMRYDPKAPTILIPLEWGYFMDETFFSQYVEWDDRFVWTMDWRCTRCISWDENKPGRINFNRMSHIDECVQVRKIMARKHHIEEAPFMLTEFRRARLLARLYH